MTFQTPDRRKHTDRMTPWTCLLGRFDGDPAVAARRFDPAVVRRRRRARGGMTRPPARRRLHDELTRRARPARRAARRTAAQRQRARRRQVSRRGRHFPGSARPAASRPRAAPASEPPRVQHLSAAAVGGASGGRCVRTAAAARSRPAGLVTCATDGGRSAASAAPTPGIASSRIGSGRSSARSAAPGASRAR